MNLLIDGSSLLWRIHYVNKHKNRNTIPNDVYLFLKSLKSYSTTYNSKNIYIAWDKKLAPSTSINFRQKETDGKYKGNRNGDIAVEVYESQDKIHEITETLGCKNIYPWIMEADDVISWLSKNLEGKNVIVTTDTDMLQLINDKTCVYHPRKKQTVDHINFKDSTGIPINHYIYYKAILGDISDNIKGIDGYGKVGSKKLAKLWVEEREKVNPEYVSIIEKNVKLMDLNLGYKLAGEKEEITYKEQIDKYKDMKPDFCKFEELCKKYNFKSIIKRMNNWKETFKTPRLLEILGNLKI